jgi:hypothetical protein
MKTEGTLITYRDNDGDLISGVVVGYDSHLRYMIKKQGASIYDALAIVTEESVQN